jgi:hypothetical protein
VQSKTATTYPENLYAVLLVWYHIVKRLLRSRSQVLHSVPLADIHHGPIVVPADDALVVELLVEYYLAEQYRERISSQTCQ